MMQQKESAARQALRKKRARKRAIRLAGAAALGALTVCVILPGMDGGQGADEPQAQKQTATAALGTIEKTVFGAGEVQPASGRSSQQTFDIAVLRRKGDARPELNPFHGRKLLFL